MIQLTDKHWAVEVPDDATDFKVKYYTVRNAIDQRDGYQLVWASSRPTHNFWILPPGSWQYLFITKGCTEEQAATVVRSAQFFFPAKHTRYVDYAHPYDEHNRQKWQQGYIKATESLQSLLRSKGCDINKNWAIIQNEHEQNDNG